MENNSLLTQERIHLMLDWQEKGDFFIPKYLLKYGYSTTVYHIKNYNIKDRIKSYRLPILYLKYISLAFNALYNSKKNEVIVCWNFTTSIALGLLCVFTFQKRNIIGLNIVALNKGKFEKIRNSVFSFIIRKNSFKVTTDSNAYVKELCLRFGLNENVFYELHYVVEMDEDVKIFSNEQDYFFIGGEAQRDWETLFKACEQLEEHKFVCIAREKYFDRRLKIPRNVKLIFDVNEEQFYKYLKKAFCVIVPLKSMMSSGNIVIIKSAIYKKTVIATNTPSTSNYIIPNETGILVEKGDVDSLCAAVKFVSNNVSRKYEYAEGLHNHVKNNFSKDYYAKRLNGIIQSFKDN